MIIIIAYCEVIKDIWPLKMNNFAECNYLAAETWISNKTFCRLILEIPSHRLQLNQIGINSAIIFWKCSVWNVAKSYSSKQRDSETGKGANGWGKNIQRPSSDLRSSHGMNWKITSAFDLCLCGPIYCKLARTLDLPSTRSFLFCWQQLEWKVTALFLFV